MNWMLTSSCSSLKSRAQVLPSRARSVSVVSQAARNSSVHATFMAKSVESQEIKPKMAVSASPASVSRLIGIRGIHHVAVICENLERSLDFYCGILGLEVNPDRPHDKLPYRGAWLWLGPEMIHLMELPNPDPLEGRPDHGGRDRHFCIGVTNLEPLEKCLVDQEINYTKSKSGRPALFFRDPDQNTLEVVEIDSWRVPGPGNNVETFA